MSSIDTSHGGPLAALYRLYNPEKPFPWGEADAPPACILDIKVWAAKLLEEYNKNPDIPMDASVRVWISPDGLCAYCVSAPPLAGGQELSLEMLKAAVEEREVKLGLINEALVSIVLEKAYLRIILIARGMEAEDGEDGYIEDLSNINETAKPMEDEYGKVDFKELGWIKNIPAGQQLCRIIPPTAGRDGFTVKGHRIHAKGGRAAPYVCGENTEYTDDGLYLISSVEGRLVQKGARYAVSQTLTIPGDVNYGTGNITSNGTVIVMGDVFPGFSVKANKDIIIYGTVDGGVLEAGGDITVMGGVLASNTGVVRAGGNLRCKFMEYGNAHVGGNAYFENLIHSNVNCVGDIMVLSGRGIVIGGELTAMGNISVVAAGNRAGCATSLCVGPTAEFSEHKKAVLVELETQAERCNRISAAVEKLRGGRGGGGEAAPA